MRGAAGRPGLLVVGTVLLLLAAGCGIAVDDTPRELAATTSTTTSSVPTDAGGDPTVLYFTKGESLVPLTRSLTDRSERSAIESLLQAPTSEEGAGVSSSIPSGTRLVDLERDGSRLSVDLSGEFNDVVGPSRQQAIGQIVLTATVLGAVDELTFSIDGEPVKVTTSRGDVEVVSACDYASMLADRAEVEDELTSGQLALLELHRDDLEQRCR